MLWMHGLGANAADMEGLVAQSSIKDLPFKHVFIDAPVRSVTINAGMSMQAWYDIYSLDGSSRLDLEGILQSRQLISAIIDEQIAAGFKEQNIILAGFSQGGAMALSTALYSRYQLGGIIALSAYMPLENKAFLLAKSTPIFLGLGQFDSVVLPLWTQMSEKELIEQGYKEITLKSYPMQHSISFEEINDVLVWINHKIIGVKSE